MFSVQHSLFFGESGLNSCTAFGDAPHVRGDYVGMRKISPDCESVPYYLMQVLKGPTFEASNFKIRQLFYTGASLPKSIKNNHLQLLFSN